MCILGLDSNTSDKKKSKIENITKAKEKEVTKQKKKPTSNVKKSESKIVAKSLTMTKVQASEKPSLTSQKKGVKRKADDNKDISKKPGRPRLNSSVTESVKGKRRNSAVSEKKTSSTFEYYNGKTAYDESMEKYKGILPQIQYMKKVFMITINSR